MKGIMLKALVPVFLLMILSALYGCDKPTSSVANTVKAATPSQETNAAPAQIPDTTLLTRAERVVAYYFHGDRRCRTCLGIQATIEQTLNERFAAETADGSLVYREVNTDQEAGKPFIQQFQLSFSTLIVALEKDGKTLQWENCDKVWEYGHEAPRLMDYTAERIKTYLAKLGAK